jgi:hypothetical protein
MKPHIFLEGASVIGPWLCMDSWAWARGKSPTLAYQNWVIARTHVGPQKHQADHASR